MSALDTSSALTLGPEPGALVVNVVLGDALTAALVLNNFGTNMPIAWPAAPVLEFGRDLGSSIDLQVAATLSADALTSTANSQATWQLAADQVMRLQVFKEARLSVNGETWWIGVVSCLS